MALLAAVSGSPIRLTGMITFTYETAQGGHRRDGHPVPTISCGTVRQSIGQASLAGDLRLAVTGVDIIAAVDRVVPDVSDQAVRTG